MVSSGSPRVAAVGGGHGLAATIRAACRYAGCTTAIVATADDGGSTGRLRNGMALPAPGDVRHCLVAMAKGSRMSAGTAEGGAIAGDRRAARKGLVDALEYRFDGTDVEGHALGNLLLAGLTAVTGDFVAAVDEASRLIGLDPEVARVVPATAEPVVLRARARGCELRGQVAISEAGDIDRVGVEPRRARVPVEAVRALAEADQIVLGPGSLYTSVLAAAVVDDVHRALRGSRATLVYVCNLRAEGAETRGYDVAAHLRALRRHGIEPDVVVTQAGGLPLGDLDAAGAGTRVVAADVARPHGLAHDSAKLAEVLADLVP